MPIQVNNRNKKISELRGRDNITTYQNHSWIPVAQYNSRINSYHNLAINLSALTSYCNSYAIDYTDNEIEKINDKLSELDKLSYIGISPDIAYYINNSSIANAIISYSFSYNTDYFEWQFL